jgi:hypothetical protein
MREWAVWMDRPGWTAATQEELNLIDYLNARRDKVMVTSEWVGVLAKVKETPAQMLKIQPFTDGVGAWQEYGE